jgi:NAD-dependent deacetylase
VLRKIHLHERAGNRHVLHLHGSLRQVRSEQNPDLVFDWEKDLHLGDLCPLGSQLRPHIVWFGEEVPMLPVAAQLAQQADVFLIVGTSLQVYPAASLMVYADPAIPFHYIDPNPQVNYELARMKNLVVLEEAATVGLPKVVDILINTMKQA